MNKQFCCFVIIVIAFCLYSCSQVGEKEIERKDNIIRLDDAIANPQDVLLSTLIDSISFISLETKEESLIDGTPRFSFSEDFIEVDTKLFDWKGNFIRKIGKHGKGAGEDIHTSPQIKFKNGRFYSMGCKILEYDSLGICTGKEFQFWKKYEGTGLGAGRNFFDFEFVEDDFVLYQFPDSIYWMNDQFDFVNGALVINADKYQKECGFSGSINRFFSKYKDQVLFYNFFNDTIYNVSSDGILPRYILSFPKSKLPEAFFPYSGNPWISKALQARGTASFKNLEEFKFSDGKINVFTFDETNDYLFFIYRENYFWGEYRGIPNPGYRIICHNKLTGETKAVKGSGFVDDILGGKPFMPLWGAFDEKLIASVNSFELIQFVKDKLAKGEPVHEKLIDISEKIKRHDNPVLVVAHIKRNEL